MPETFVWRGGEVKRLISVETFTAGEGRSMLLEIQPNPTRRSKISPHLTNEEAVNILWRSIWDLDEDQLLDGRVVQSIVKEHQDALTWQMLQNDHQVH